MNNFIRAPIKKILYDNEPMNWKYRVAVAKDFKGNSKQYFWFQSLDVFIQHLNHTGEKWFYEVIDWNQESCMYLDLEWYHDCGEFDSPEDILKVLLQEYQEFMKSKFDIVVEPNTWKILSSHGTLSGNKVKYSFHLIDRSGLTLIDHNHRKRLVSLFTIFLEDKDSPLCRLWKACKKEKKPPIDTAVYAQWQNFRTIWSSKHGESRVLVPTDIAGRILEISPDETKLYFATHITSGPKMTIDSQVLELEYDSVKKRTKKLVCNRKPFSNSISDWELSITKSPAENELKLNDASISFYLSCIPNGGSGQDWEVYFSICAAVQRAGGSYSEFESWAKMSSKFDGIETMKLWDSLCRVDRKCGYNLGTLKNMAKHCWPKAFENEYQDFTTRLPMEVYDISKYMKPIQDDKKFVICQSPMGSGKTFAMIDLIKRHRPERVLVLSSRQTFTLNIKNDLIKSLLDVGIEFKSYKDLDDLRKCAYLIVQMESLCRLEECKAFDLVLIDESEACLKQFNSRTMIQEKGKLWKNLSIFNKLLSLSKRNVFLDAFLSNRTIDLVESMTCKDSDAIISVNMTMPTQRHAYHYIHKATWEEKLLDDICRGKRVVVFWGSLKEGLEFERDVLEMFDNSISMKFYQGKDKQSLHDLSNVEESWKNVQVLMYTSTITVGVNYNIPECFDAIYVYGSSSGCSARDIIQATMRVRHLKENKLHFYSNAFIAKDQEVVDIDDLKARLAMKNKLLEELDEQFEELLSEDQLLLHNLKKHWKSEDPWMTRLYLFNALEERESKQRFNQMFYKFLEKCNYQIEYVNEKSTPRVKKDHQEIEYSSIPILNSVGLELICSKERTIMESLMIEKYFFIKELQSNLNISQQSYWWKIWCQNKELLNNLKVELTEGPCKVHAREKDHVGLKTFMSNTGVKLSILNKVYKILEIGNSLDTSSIIKAHNIDRLVTDRDLMRKLSIVFDLKQKGSMEDKCTLDKKTVLRLVDSALSRWYGGKLSKLKESRRQIRIAGKKNDVYDYKLEGNSVPREEILQVFNWKNQVI